MRRCFVYSVHYALAEVFGVGGGGVLGNCLGTSGVLAVGENCVLTSLVLAAESGGVGV